MEIKSRIEALRNWLQQNSIDAIILPSNDPHQSEYVAEHWKTREWISGFTGSAGTVVITQDHAGLWTDSRYFLQASEELQIGGLTLHKLVTQGEAEYLEWLASELLEGKRVGIDKMLFSKDQVSYMDHIFAKDNIELVLIEDPFDFIWANRPSLPKEMIFEIDSSFTGQTRQERVKSVFQKLQEKGCSHMLVTALDEVAWLLNLRGRDVSCNPVFIAYAMIHPAGVDLFVDNNKVSINLKEKLASEGVQLYPYSALEKYLSELSVDVTLLLDNSKTAIALYEAVGTPKILETISPITLLKAKKNATEQHFLRQAMIKDGVALLKAHRWLELKIEEGTPIEESEFADYIALCRSQQQGYFGESFDAIIGFKSNGAIVHYRPVKGQSASIEGRGLLLFDSGGQYFDGTTDITRTICIGSPTQEEQKYYTLVLKGHIALAKAIFPEGTKGVQLDILARQFLWADMANYGHGTGHGVGFFMNVHEPPQGFVTGLNERGKTSHEEGMYTSNEPGYYKEQSFGIRIENLVLTQVYGKSDYGSFLCFETITLYPIDTSLIDNTLLAPEEKYWLNQYHQKVQTELLPFLNKEEQQWLIDKCKPID
jgi:Xaa-Pro aminopeptidase